MAEEQEQSFPEDIKPMEDSFWVFYLAGALDCMLVGFMIPLLKAHTPEVASFTIVKTYIFLAIAGAIGWCALNLLHNVEDILRSGFINTVLYLPFCYAAFKISYEYLAPKYAHPGNPYGFWLLILALFGLSLLLNYIAQPPVKIVPPPPEPEETSAPVAAPRRQRRARPALRGTYKNKDLPPWMQAMR